MRCFVFKVLAQISALLIFQVLVKLGLGRDATFLEGLLFLLATNYYWEAAPIAVERICEVEFSYTNTRP